MNVMKCKINVLVVFLTQ